MWIKALIYMIVDFLIKNIAFTISSYSYIFNSITIASVSPGSTSSYTISSSWSVSTPATAPTLTQSDGSSLPSWITFDGTSNTVAWTAPMSSASSTLQLSYWVADTTYPSKIGKTRIEITIGLKTQNYFLIYLKSRLY